MSSRAPHTTDAAIGLDTASGRKLASRFLAWTGARADAVLIGVPCAPASDPSGSGAAQGPTAIRNRLLGFEMSQNLEHAVATLWLGDTGDLEVVSDSLEATVSRLSAAIASILSTSAVALVVSGARETSFGSIQALVNSSPDAGGIHIAARSGADPGPEGGGGTQPVYRRIVEKLDVVGSHFVEFALQPNLNSEHSRTWLTDRNVRSVPLEAVRGQGAGRALSSELEILSDRAGALFVSVELESFAAVYAPGVSHRSPNGLVPEEGRRIAFVAGRHPRVRLFQIVGLNPALDVEERTADLALLLISSFLAGLADRKAHARPSRA